MATAAPEIVPNEARLRPRRFVWHGKNLPASRLGRRWPPDILQQHEVDMLFLAVTGSVRAKMRSRCALALMVRCGLRANEVVTVRANNVTIDDEGRSTIRVMAPKGLKRGKKPRVVGMGRRSTELYMAPWLEIAKTLPALTEARRVHNPLICLIDNPCIAPVMQNGDPLGPQWALANVHRWAASAGIGRRCHPHMLRHTFAFQCAQEGRSLPWISRALGHASIARTATYLEHISPMDVLEGFWARD